MDTKHWKVLEEAARFGPCLAVSLSPCQALGLVPTAETRSEANGLSPVFWVLGSLQRT